MITEIESEGIKMMTLMIVVLVIGALALLALLNYAALVIYSKVLVRNGKWLDTNRPEWIDWLLDNLT